MNARRKKAKQKKEWNTDSLEAIKKMEKGTFEEALAGFQTMPLQKSFLYKNTLNLCRAAYSNHVGVYDSAAIEELVTKLTDFFLPRDGRLYIPDYSPIQQRMLLPHFLCKAFDYVFNEEKIESINLKVGYSTSFGLVFKNETFPIHQDISQEIRAVSQEFHNKHTKIATPKPAEEVSFALTTSLYDTDKKNEDSIFSSPQSLTPTPPILMNSNSSSSSNSRSNSINNFSILNTFIHRKPALNYMPESYTRTLLKLGSPIISNPTRSSSSSADVTTSSISNTPFRPLG
jgi:hypothetical protein